MYLNGIGKELIPNEILSNISFQDDDIIYVGGSLIEGSLSSRSIGMGNALSDVDVFIIRNNDDFIISSSVYIDNVKKTTFLTENGIGYDIEIYNYSIIQSLIDSIEQCHIDPHERVINMLSLPSGWALDDANEFLTRLYYSNCIHNKLKYNEIKKSINFVKFSIIYKLYIINNIDNTYEDIDGNLGLKQIYTALHCMRSAFIDLLKLIILHEGEFIDRDKWTFLKFFNITKETNKYTEVYQNYKNLFLKDITDLNLCEHTIITSKYIVNNAIEKIIVGDELKI